ncbi:BglG family transcription antiterminator [Bifidobacterium aquikefiri]|uniref:Transcriptional antiterminator n=1 Tax=Bifidobacterium aquikefiri TaxID=1653207 RepID=A0A261G6P6_9BIFI|nr:PRD domain-containing protein [Bifidobacterium aquikefiri]OZG67100.1 transcriptional antiterminator [Bifidobacterium aquikefiri]
MNAQEIPTSKDRKYYILARLVDGEHLSYQRLSNDYFISRSSIAHDVEFIKSLLAKDNVSLGFDNSGTFIGGGEVVRQKVIKRIVTDLLRVGDEGSPILKLFIDPSPLHSVQKIFQKQVRVWQLEVPEYYIDDIVISTAIVVYRGLLGHHIADAKGNQLGKILFQFDKYPLVYELIKGVEDAGVYSFTPDELRYLSYIVIGNGFKFFMKDLQIPASFKSKVKSLISTVSDGLNTDLTQDTRLHADLTVHLYQMFLRLQADTTVINPLLDEIQKNYPQLYGTVWYAFSDFGNDNHIAISDDEVGFLTIHFQAAVERTKSAKRVLFVCPNGIGTSSLVSAKMHRILPEVSLIEVVSQVDLIRQDLSDVALIISTVRLPEQPVPVANISPMITTRDMKTIMNRYIDVSMDSSEQELDFSHVRSIPFLAKGHVLFCNARSRAEIIDALMSVNEWPDIEQRNMFRQTVFQRDTVQSTYLDNGFVISHGDPSLVAHSCIGVAILDKAIDWMNNRADVIALLMIKKEDRKSIEPFMNVIMNGINNKDWFISTMMEIGSHD